MSRPIISAEGLSKAYRIGVKRDQSATLTGAAIRLLKAPLENFRQLRRLNTYSADDNAADTYWALKDVSFEIAEGEVVGIIGRNGAGKSTLLKILSRITDPTSGRAVLRGRVSSLLEVGTGFHPELSGRENVYLNGTILGMTKKEVDRKFDEIVEFSGVEKFLDTPIKRYSSGMTVRLAFAVAAHLEPEILIIDEVLAVGDADFQKKCLGKMKDVAKGGRTVLFVSHNLVSVASLCTQGILLAKGRVDGTGTALDMVRKYENNNPSVGKTDWPAYRNKDLDFAATLACPQVRSGETAICRLRITLPDDVQLTGLSAVVLDYVGARLGIADFRPTLRAIPPLCGSINVEIGLPCHNWVEGHYTLDWFIETNRFSCDVPTEWSMEVLPSDRTMSQGAYDRQYRGHMDIYGSLEPIHDTTTISKTQ